ncbi:hypothetical protein CIK05_09575 [Bdellovibrio sp. qaytius]|nr:hypothetical protein CIK05_09575 [Bdellovibrio sp. qaytius]
MPNLSQHFQTETYFSINSEDELINSFRLRDQKKLVLPQGLIYPFNVRSYFTWQESNAVYTYLLFKTPNWDMPRGVVFKRFASNGEPTGGLCSWCNAYGSSEDIGMLSLHVDANVSLGYFLCHDLRCIEKIEEASARAGKSPEKNIAQLYHRMASLFENLNK